jgi:spermidine/putrescine transport system permease protein
MAERFSVQRLPGFGPIAILVFVALYLPILTMVFYSFNAGNAVSDWQGFSLKWYAIAWSNADVQDAALRSLTVASSATLIATTLATMAALGTTRRRAFRGRGAVELMINQPLLVPDIVTAVSLLIFVAAIKVATGYQGLLYLILAHSAVCLPFAYLPIKARLQGMDLALETAAADLYATPFATFRHVTLPLLMPAIIAGAMLAFVISLDDVVITSFVKSGGQDTLPTYMLGLLRRGTKPDVNALATVLLCFTVLLLTTFFLLTRKRE